MTNAKLMERIKALSDDCAATHAATSVHLAVVANGLAHPAIMQAVNESLLPVAQRLAAAHTTVQITSVVIEGNAEKPQPKDTNEHR